MLIRNRQGWRLLIVLSRLAVAGLLVAGTTGVLFSQPLQAQIEPDKPPQPAPPVHPGTQVDGSDAVTPSEAPPAPEPVAPAAPGPTPVETSKADDSLPSLLTLPPSLERLAAQRNALNQVLCKDRRHQLLLRRGREALIDGDIATALENFHALTDARHDAFFWPEHSASPRGARTSVDEVVRSLPLQVRQACERLHGPEASALQSESRTAEGAPSLLQLLKRFPHTNAGREAMERELLRAYDAGQSELALQFARRLAVDEHHCTQLSPPIRRLVQRLTELSSEAEESRQNASTSPPALTPQWVYSFTDGVREQAWHTGGSHTPAADAVARVCEAIVAAADDWLADRRERRLPVATANESLVVGDMLVVRDFSGVRAIHLETGALKWHRICCGAVASITADRLRSGSACPLSFQEFFAGRGAWGRLTSDGQFVYFIEDVADHPHVPGADKRGAPPEGGNRLVAVPLHSDGPHVEPVWTRPGPGDGSLDGHRFLGPPLAVDGRLFVLSEFAMRVECTALDATDGRILWRQPIALATSPIAGDAARLRISCTPQIAASTIVCPTEMGVLVGVDPLTGSLRWIYDHIDEDQRHSAGRWSSSTQRNFGCCELPSRTLVRDGRVFHLPFRSDSVHCVDACSGQPAWPSPVPRRGALSLSAVDEQNVLLVGPRDVTSLSPTDGAVRWTTSCPEPAGHGIIAGDEYLLPLSGGQCQALSLNDGTPRGARFGRLLHELALPPDEPSSPEAPRLQLVSYMPTPQAGEARQLTLAGGNLSAAGDRIVVTTPTSVAVYPMSVPLLSELTTRESHGRLPAEQQLQAAMLHLVLENHSLARTRLQLLLESSDTPAVTGRAVRLLRELLFAELNTADDPRDVLAQLQRLPGDKAAALRLLVHRIDASIQLGESQALITALQELLAHESDETIDRDGDTRFRVNAYCDVADRLAQLRSTSPEGVSRELTRYVSETADLAVQSGNVEYSRKVVRLFDGWPQVGVLRNELAAADITAGRLQRAELLLLKNCLALNQAAAARAHRLLVDLYASAGLQREAASHLIQLEERFRGSETGAGLPGLADLQHSPGVGVWEIVARRREPPDFARRVRILEHVCGEECGTAVECASARALEHHDRIRRKFLTGDDASWTIIDRGIIAADRSHSTLRLINRDSGQSQGEVEVPSAYWQLAGGGEGFCGQLVPICGRAAHGISLLERRSIWSSHDADDSQREKVKVGPIGYDYCVLQTPRRLTVVDPATGALRWFRDDLPPDVGLLSDESTGIIGDNQTLTLFDADQTSYTVFRMGSGQLVRQGQLEVSAQDVRRHRRSIGDRLVHVISGDEGDCLRIWDAGSDQMSLDLPLHERLYTRIPDTDIYACISRSGALVFIDASAGCVELQVPLPAIQLENVNELHVAVSPECFLVNLVGCDTRESDDAVAAMDETELPAMRVQGLLLVVSRSGEIRWSRSVPDAALLTDKHVQLPILTLISRVRDSDHRQPATMRVEILDLRSGEVLAQRSDLLRTRFVQSDYQHDRGRLTLIGLDSQIEIDFGASRPEMLIHAEVEPSNDQLTR